MHCPSCSTPVEISDNYCRQCGVSLRASRLPALVPERRVARSLAPSVPTLVRRGVAALIVGKAVQWAARQIVRKALGVASGKAQSGTIVQRSASAETAPAVSQARGVFGITTIWQRTHWFIPDDHEKTPRGWGPFRRN